MNKIELEREYKFKRSKQMQIGRKEEKGRGRSFRKKKAEEG